MKHEINITYDDDTGKLIEVREDGRTVVDREKGGQMMSVPEAMAMLYHAGRLCWEEEPYPKGHRRAAESYRREMVRLFCAIFGEPRPGERLGTEEEIRLGRGENGERF